MPPLFRRFAEAITKAKSQEDAVRQISRIARDAAAGKVGFQQIGQIRKGFREVRTSAKTGDKASYGRLSQLVKDTVFNEVMRQFGPLGSVIRAMIRPSAKAMTEDIEKELKAASDLLQAFGYQVSPPVDQTGSGIGLQTPAAAPRQRVQPPMETPRRQQERPAPLQTEPGTPARRDAQTPEAVSNYVTINIGGRKYRIRRDDPLLTGEMIRVKSSNVHSIGYIWNSDDPAKGTLQVRFLDHRKGRSAKAGAGYQYFAVHPEVFVSFTKAASKGKFVWDRLRIRGTVSGHQYQYSIATLASDGYTPRKARRVGDHEYFLQRTVKGSNGKVYKSQLPQRMVGPYNPSPNRGTPDRGEPNRGTPNRGR